MAKNSTKDAEQDTPTQGHGFSLREAVLLFHLCTLASIPIAYLYTNGEKAEDTTTPAETVTDTVSQEKKGELSSTFSDSAYALDFVENTPAPEALNRSTQKTPPPRL